jgi:hypothetical protein
VDEEGSRPWLDELATRRTCKKIARAVEKEVAGGYRTKSREYEEEMTAFILMS